MPFGLRNEQGPFQRAMVVVLAPVKWQTALVYLDDAVMFSKILEEHITHVRQALTLSREAGVTFKLKKWRSSPTLSMLMNI